MLLLVRPLKSKSEEAILTKHVSYALLDIEIETLFINML